MVGVIDRCPTGISGFDQISRGGFVRNSDNLIVGGPGSGKTTFLLQFLWNGATRFNENGLYISFEPDIVDTLNDAMAYGWDFTKLSNAGKIKFMKFAPQTSIDELRSQLRKVIAKNNIRRICFDPISILAMNLDSQGKIRQKIFELSSLMKRLKVTTLFADESLQNEGIQSHGEEGWAKTDILRFLSDSVTLFYNYSVSGVGDRAVQILKMRRTHHKRNVIGMQIREYGLDMEFNENEPSYREATLEIVPSSLVLNQNPLDIIHVPRSSFTNINRGVHHSEEPPKEASPELSQKVSDPLPQKPGIGTVPEIPAPAPQVPLQKEIATSQNPIHQRQVALPHQTFPVPKPATIPRKVIAAPQIQKKPQEKVNYSPAIIPQGPLPAKAPQKVEHNAESDNEWLE